MVLDGGGGYGVVGGGELENEEGGGRWRYAEAAERLGDLREEVRV
jgi:hypothetical protein